MFNKLNQSFVLTCVQVALLMSVTEQKRRTTPDQRSAELRKRECLLPEGKQIKLGLFAV